MIYAVLRWVVRTTIWDYRSCPYRSPASCLSAIKKMKKTSNRCCGEWDLALDVVHEVKREFEARKIEQKRKQREKDFKRVFDQFDKDGSGDMDQKELADAYFEVIEWLANKAAKRKPPSNRAAVQDQ
eukprot:COSAG01_NODE_27724_length_678_cov_1.687392_1_plen_126_part_10